MLLMFLLMVLVEALTRQSDKFLFRHWPNIRLASFIVRVVLVLSRRGLGDHSGVTPVEIHWSVT